jgi:hypothetical protein
MWIANGIIKRRGTNSTEELGKTDAQGVQWRDLSLVMARREIEVEGYGSGYYIDWVELVEIARVVNVNQHVLDMVKAFKAAIPYEIENPKPETTEKPEEKRPDGYPE